VRVLFATAELAPFVKVGGLGDAASGLVLALRRRGVDVEVALPDYGTLDLTQTGSTTIDVPDWAGPALVRRGSLDGFPQVALISTPTMARPHPYNDSEGRGWPDNDTRFLSFSAGIAAMTRAEKPDLLHLNDWHTGASLGFLPQAPPTVLTIHNLAYQGWTDGSWLRRLGHRPEAFEWYGGVNPLSGAVALADRVVTVSPTFAAETLAPETGFGLDQALASRGAEFSGILNGIDTGVWDPASDPHLSLHYASGTAGRKREIGRRLATELGLPPGEDPLIGVVTRLTGQKGVDIVLDAAARLEHLRARMVLLGSGERALAEAAVEIESRSEGRFVFREGYDEGLSHRIFAGSDLYLMPSRFEPAGLTQMQAMRYGSIPVVTDVGGLHDTVIDADSDPTRGTGFVAAQPTTEAIVGALGRAIAAWRSTRRRGEIRRRGMSRDWSWDAPAGQYHRLYQEIISAG